MRCCPRSTRSFANLAGVLLAATAIAGAGREATDSSRPEEPVRRAIARAVQSRLGPSAQISVDALSGVRLANGGLSLLATPDPTARIGRSAHFVLTGSAPGLNTVRVGEATAIVSATANAVLTRRPVARGTELAADDVVVVATSLAGRLMKAFPDLEEVVGARTTRDLGADVVVTRSEIVARLLVRAG